MDVNKLTENPYLLLTPGPLTTTPEVRKAMLKDWCTWDDDYKNLVESVRRKLEQLATDNNDEYTSVLMQGSGSFTVESVIGTVVPENGKLLVLENGAYGERIGKIASTLGIDLVEMNSGEQSKPDLKELDEKLKNDPEITHVAVVHVETTTGMVNPIEDIGKVVKKHNRTYIVDSMSGFGGIEMDLDKLGIDYMTSSANKCIQGVPGFGFTIAKKAELEKSKNQARSLSLDLYNQWETMENDQGKFRFTSPTHTVHAFYQALIELEEEGGVSIRSKRYKENQRSLVQGMRDLGFSTLLDDEKQSPIITSFYFPDDEKFTFQEFYNRLKEKGFVIYPGKVTDAETFRIGNIGDVHPDDIQKLLSAVKESMYWKKIKTES